MREQSGSHHVASAVSDGGGTLHRIERSREGFLPEELTIRAGDTVVFASRTGTPFWPASNTHPLHTIYPAFDPKRPLGPEETWKFTFDRPGAWRYHDHLEPALGGVIVVLEEGGVAERSLPNCDAREKLMRPEREQCYDELITASLKKGGVAAAFATLKGLYQSDSEFVTTGCHQQMHKIGDRVYPEYARHIRKGEFSRLVLPPESTYCGYGFYHGILEHTFRDYPDIELGKQLCEYLTETLADDIPRIRLNCFHGLGHASVFEPADGKGWGNGHKLVSHALAVCDNISERATERRECLEGAFNVMSDWISRKEFGLAFDEGDPMRFCKEQRELEHQRACYYELGMHLWSQYGEDLSKIAAVAATIDDEHSAVTIVHVAAAGLMERGVVKDRHAEYIETCRRLPERFRVDCIGAIAAGLIAHGEPEQEYKKALAFCGEEAMRADEHDACYRAAIYAFRGVYTKEKTARICETVADPYRQYCVAPLPDYAQ